MNHWFKILKAFRDGKFPNYHFGLTPRFLIGACQIPIGKKFESKESAFEATNLLFKEMQNYNKGGLVVTSNKCDIHDGSVMTLAESKWSEKSIGTSFQEIWERYGQEIVDGNYHISAEELKILNEVFNN